MDRYRWKPFVATISQSLRCLHVGYQTTHTGAPVYCSYVELIAATAEDTENSERQQRPKWFVSHFWGEKLINSIKCLEEHARCRKLDDNTPYWICAFANNQWVLEKEIQPSSGIEKTSFRKALDICDGIVQIIDENAECFNRIWCRYEGFVALTVGANTKLYDFVAKRTPLELWIRTYTSHNILTYDVEEVDVAESSEGKYTDENGVKHVREVTWEAIALLDQRFENFDDVFQSTPHFDHESYDHTSYWTERQNASQYFPKNIVPLALSSAVENAEASLEDDRLSILHNVLRYFNPNHDSSTNPPPTEHDSYSRLNNLLRARLAMALWIPASRDSDEWGFENRAQLVRDSGIKAWSLDAFKISMDQDLLEIAQAFPLELEALALSFHDYNTDLSVIEVLAASLPRSLQKLYLAIYASRGFPWKSLPPNLTDFVLVLKAMEEEELDLLARALPRTLQKLDLRLDRVRTTNAGFRGLLEHLPPGLLKLQICLGGSGKYHKDLTSEVIVDLAKKISDLPSLVHFTLRWDQFPDKKDIDREKQDIDSCLNLLREAWSPRDPSEIVVQCKLF